MRVFQFFILTFVLTSMLISTAVHAAGTKDAPDHSQPNTDEDFEDTDGESLKKQNLLLSTPPPADPSLRSYYYPYKSALSFHLGLHIVPDKMTPDDPGAGVFGLFGFDYLVPDPYSPQWEFGLELSSQSTGFITGALRWIANRNNLYRPYFRTGMALQLVGGEQLATFGNIENYFLKAGIGMEDVTSGSSSRSVRLAADIIASTNSSGLLLSFGYSFGM